MSFFFVGGDQINSPADCVENEPELPSRNSVSALKKKMPKIGE